VRKKEKKLTKGLEEIITSSLVRGAEDMEKALVNRLAGRKGGDGKEVRRKGKKKSSGFS